MNSATLNLTVAQALSLCRVLGSASQELSPPDKFGAASVIRRIRALGDYDPEIGVFRLLDPVEFERKTPDGATLFAPDGAPVKGYRYSSEVLRGPFALLAISVGERTAMLHALTSLATPETADCDYVAMLADVAEWIGVQDEFAASMSCKRG